ncbi:Lysine-specific demethylase 3A [Blyttiomyces sp. JEL0837]|nr:Lysine-specific demethylase 3A [Blyttiomyces sp. JEL0837]
MGDDDEPAFKPGSAQRAIGRQQKRKAKDQEGENGESRHEKNKIVLVVTIERTLSLRSRPPKIVESTPPLEMEDEVGPPRRRASVQAGRKIAHRTSEAAGRKREPVQLAMMDTIAKPLPPDCKFDLQGTRCLSGPYKPYPKCKSCIGKKTGDECRFLNFRVFTMDRDGDVGYGPYFIDEKRYNDVIKETNGESTSNAADQPAADGNRRNADKSEIATDSTAEVVIENPPKSIVTNLENERYIMSQTVSVLEAIIEADEKAMAASSECFFRSNISGVRHLCDKLHSPAQFIVAHKISRADMNWMKKCISGVPGHSQAKVVLGPSPNVGHSITLTNVSYCSRFGLLNNSDRIKQEAAKADLTDSLNEKQPLSASESPKALDADMSNVTVANKSPEAFHVTSSMSLPGEVRTKSTGCDDETQVVPSPQVEIESSQTSISADSGIDAMVVEIAHTAETAASKVEPVLPTLAPSPGNESSLPGGAANNKDENGNSHGMDVDLLENGCVHESVPTAPAIDLANDSHDYVRLKPTGTKEDQDTFEREWKAGRAFVFEGGRDMIKADWSPQFFKDHHGTKETTVVDCMTKASMQMLVGDFFDCFMDESLRPRDRKGKPIILKLPDWPSHTEFEREFPEHFRDFDTCIPFADYTGRNGNRNLAARIPKTYLPPDLGPKMYNAFGSSDAEETGFGTTPIHLDMADAVNLMTFASWPSDFPKERGKDLKSEESAENADSNGNGFCVLLDNSLEDEEEEEDGPAPMLISSNTSPSSQQNFAVVIPGSSEGSPSNPKSSPTREPKPVTPKKDSPANDVVVARKQVPAAAVWDIYSVEDLPHLREFLREHAASINFSVDDPIHDQVFYLNQPLRKKLWETKGIKGRRIFQNVGDAVFIPAGCAHQVCNYMDCIKVATDFVSPENLSACAMLTTEFRRLSRTHRRRQDLLQLKAILWSTWKTSPLFKDVVLAQEETQDTNTELVRTSDDKTGDSSALVEESAV